MTGLKIAYEEYDFYSGPRQSPERLFEHLARRLAPRPEHFTLWTSIFALGPALPSLLDDFLAQCSNLKSLHLELSGQEPAPGVIDLIAARVRQLPRLQNVSVPSLAYLRPTGAVVTAAPIRHLQIDSELDFEGLEYIQREFGATLERLQVGGITSPDKRVPALLFPALWSLQIEQDPAPHDIPLMLWLDPKTPLKILDLGSMGENLFQSLQEFVRLQPMPTFRRLIVQGPDRNGDGQNNTESWDRQRRDICSRALKTWLWAEPLGVEVLQSWLKCGKRTRRAVANRSLGKFLEARRREGGRSSDVLLAAEALINP